MTECCAICHEEVDEAGWCEEDESKRIITLHCSHTFHSNCIHEWWTHAETCPVCRAFFFPEEASERQILTQFYHALDGPNWIDNTNWLSDAPLKQWYGVSCGRYDKTTAKWRVNRLDLANNGLEGIIPESFSGLEKMMYIELHRNRITGHLPDFRNMSHLSDICMHHNRLTGPGLPTGFPPLFTHLSFVSLSDNCLDEAACLEWSRS